MRLTHRRDPQPGSGVGQTREQPGPKAHAAVRAAYAAFEEAWIDVMDLPGISEQSAAQAVLSQETRYRLYQADKAWYEAWHAANRQAHPELYRDNASPGVMTAADWQARYPLLNMDRGQPTPYDLGLTTDRAARLDPGRRPDLPEPANERDIARATIQAWRQQAAELAVARDPAAETGTDPELEAG